nr:Chain A, Envelope glycoprotein [Human immunodeficiency virus 1]
AVGIGALFLGFLGAAGSTVGAASGGGKKKKK